MRVIGRCFGLAESAAHRPHVFGLDENAHRVEALRVVGPDRSGEHEEEVFAARSDAQVGVGGDERGADVERAARAGWDPVAFREDEGADGAREELGRHWLHVEASGRVGESLDALVEAEEKALAVWAAVGLESLEDGLAVVQTDGGGVDLERPQGLDARVGPAAFRGEVGAEEVVGEVASKAKGARVRQRRAAAFGADGAELDGNGAHEDLSGAWGDGGARSARGRAVVGKHADLMIELNCLAKTKAREFERGLILKMNCRRFSCLSG